MIVLGADTHKRSHTIAALSATTGEPLGEQTVQSGAKGSAALLGWARGGLGAERVWALEDCRHVSGSLERFLIERGERVLRVHSTLMSASWRQVRQHRRACGCASGAPRRPRHVAGGAAGPARARLAAARRSSRTTGPRPGALNNTLQWHVHDLWPGLRLPGSSLFYGNWGPRIARRLARSEQTMRVGIARDELRRVRELTQTIKALEAELADLVAQIAPPPARRARVRTHDGSKTHRRYRRRPTVRHRRQTRARRRRRPGPRQLRQDQPPPPRPRRQPPNQRDLHRIAVTRLRCQSPLRLTTTGNLGRGEFTAAKRRHQAQHSRSLRR